MRIEPVTAAIGAEITGVTLSGKLEPAVLDEIYDALSKYLVLFFRDQDLSPEDHYEFGKTFGELAQPHPVYPHLPGFDRVVLLENDGDRPPDTDDWHTDLTFQAKTPFLSILHAREVPETGGDTLWASMYRAFDTLPPEIQQLASRLHAVHLMEMGSAVHPVAPKHPVTGKQLLFVNRSFTQHIVGMLKAESDRLLEYLFSHIDTPNNQVRFRWSKGAVAMWDNRCTQHFAVADYLPDYRRMHRVIVDTDRRAGD
jgi:taurine dioxygenase